MNNMKPTVLMAATFRFRIDGMHCAACVSRVETALKKLPGVIDAVVNLATNEARVVVEPGCSPNVDRAIDEIGYHATPVEITLINSTPRQTYGADELLAIVRDLAWPIPLTLAIIALSWRGDSGIFTAVITLLLTTVVVCGAGRQFFIDAVKSIRHLRADMDVLVAIGAGAAYLASLSATIQLMTHSMQASHASNADACGSHAVAATLIIVFVRMGRSLEARARRKASDAIGRLLDLQAPIAHVLRASTDLLSSETEVEVPVDQVIVGDTVLVRAGERIPVDGIVLAGVTDVDESSFTGESLPVRKQPNDRVLGGSVNQSGSFRFRAEHVGDEMTLRRIAALVSDAQGTKAPIARLADRVAGVFVPIILAIASVTFIVWFNHSDLNNAITRTVAVLVVACPCALGLATPTAIMVAMGKGAELGVLFKDGAALEQTAALQIVLFDKTGTLTEGRPEIVEATPTDGVSRTELIRAAATIAGGSNHPLARAVVLLANKESVAFGSTPENMVAEPGLGLRGTVDGEVVLLGNWRWIVSQAAHLIATGESSDSIDRRAALGRTPMFVTKGDRLLGSLAAEDRLRSTAADTTLALRHLHVATGIVSGDRLAVVKSVAHKLGISLIEAERLPIEKAEVVRSLQATGRKVAMIGDGVNDAPALAAADVGFAIGIGADIAIEAADVTLVSNDPRAVPHAIELARRTLSIIRQNLFFAFAYNLISIPLAAGLLSAFGPIMLPPGFAAAAMSASSVLVVTNSLRLRRFKPTLSL